MKRLVVMIILFLVFSSSVAVADEDYKRLYLEQKVQSLRMEIQVIQMRFAQAQVELPQVLAELKAHAETKSSKEEKIVKKETIQDKEDDQSEGN